MSELATQFSSALDEVFDGGPEWLHSLRQTGIEQFRAHGLPTRKDENWKYTGLGVLEKTAPQLLTVVDTVSATRAHPEPLIEAGIQVKMLDGRLLEQNGAVPTGLTVQSLTDALSGDFDGLQSMLESLPESQQNAGSTQGFSALNTATLNGGVVVHVAEGVDAGKILLNWSSSAVDDGRFFNSRICIILERDAKLELLEQFSSPNTNVGNVVVQCELRANANLQHVRLQQEAEDAVLITRTEVKQQDASEYHYYGFDLGGRLVRHDLHSSLLGPGAKCALNGAYLVDGNRHVDNHARVDHIAVGGYSEQYFRGIAGGSGRAVFNTAVCVHPGADETEARQSNANILLSTRAEVDTKPELEIYADEVIASHGATVGQLDEQAVFYMRSRGLSEQQARQLLTSAFCRSVSDKLTDPVLGEVIAQRMMDVMPQAE